MNNGSNNASGVAQLVGVGELLCCNASGVEGSADGYSLGVLDGTDANDGRFAW